MYNMDAKKYVNNTNITNCNGRFYAGMTLEDAKRRGVDKCTFRRDFYNLDKNHDGVLSVDEILLERERDAKIEKWDGTIFAAWGLLDLLTAKGKTSRVIGLGIYALVSVIAFYRMHTINKGTDEIKKQLANNNFNKNA